MTVTVAVVQASAVPFDLDASLGRVEHWLSEAARQGAQVVVFGESWLTAYPAWIDHWPRLGLWDDPEVKAIHARFRRCAITVPGPHCERLGQLAAEHGVTLVIGVNERVDAGPGHGTLFNTILGFDARGQRVLHHRKLVPTHTERMVWGPGDAHGLEVAQTEAGRIGGLVCWEHWMPLARQALHEQAEQIHVALWPTVKPMAVVASRHYAFEGRCFVLAAGGLMHRDTLPSSLADALVGVADDGWLMRGGSCIVGPDGEFVVEPVPLREQILLADLELGRIDEEAMALDVSGHYARPELLRLTVTPGPPRNRDSD
ncbi:MAG: carbon-nitrogen hydrolase family protein [Myxococcota bacterium]